MEQKGKLDYFADMSINMFKHYLRDSFSFSEGDKSEILLKFDEVAKLMQERC